MLHGVYMQEIYNISFDTGARGREKLKTLDISSYNCYWEMKRILSVLPCL
jgi:hypothetical protein